jgi:hypothetical protein
MTLCGDPAMSQLRPEGPRLSSDDYMGQEYISYGHICVVVVGR